jgi:hypothetical protein
MTGTPAQAQQADVRFACSTERIEQGRRVAYADSGTVRLSGAGIVAFQWESAIFSPPRSADCSIDESDGLRAETTDGGWRITVQDPQGARDRRGYAYGSRNNCSIRIERDGDGLRLRPDCPALCGSRMNFSELTVDTKTGACRYQQ